MTAYTGLACLFWSGSKAGWLIMLGMGAVAFLHVPQLGKRLKAWVILLSLVVGLGAFYAKHAGYFAKKTNSATARLDYWQAAWQLFKEKPIFGSGPGTFKVGYQRLRRPGSEPTRLAHNDYLQQASDSGFVGMCSYLVFMLGSVAVLYRRCRPGERGPMTGPATEPRRLPKQAPSETGWQVFAVWLGVAGLAAQEFVEFSLYIPALAWPFFLSIGWLWGRTAPFPIRIDNPAKAG
jgi:O-antigen ligase